MDFNASLDDDTTMVVVSPGAQNVEVRYNLSNLTFQSGLDIPVKLPFDDILNPGLFDEESHSINSDANLPMKECEPKFENLEEHLFSLKEGSGLWQWNELSGRYELVRGEAVDLIAQDEFLKNNTLEIRVKIFDSTDGHILRSCKRKDHSNIDFPGAPFKILAPSKKIEREIDADGTYCYRITDLTGKGIQFIPLCFSSEPENHGQKEKNRKWKIEILGNVGSTKIQQAIPIQVVKILRSPHRLKKSQRGEKRKISDSFDGVEMKVVKKEPGRSLRDRFKAVMKQKLEDKINKFSEEEFMAMLCLLPRIELNIAC